MKVSWALFLGVWAVHTLTPVATQGDSRWSVPVALSLLHRGSADLLHYPDELIRHDLYAVECVMPDHRHLFPVRTIEDCPGGKIYSLYPLSVSIVAVPAVAALEGALAIGKPALVPVAERFDLPMVRALAAGDLVHGAPLVEKIVASLCTAAATVAVFRTALLFLTPLLALSHALTFAFGTLAYSLLSRALWHHAPSVLLNSLVVLLLAREKLDRRSGAALGFVLALGFYVRPTNAVVVAVIALLYSIRLRLPPLWPLLGAAPVMAFFAAINWFVYGQMVAPYFRVSVPGISTGSIHSLFLHDLLGQAILANLISPARGLFVFMPFLLFLLVPGVWKAPMFGLWQRQRPWFVAIFALQLLVVSGYADWVGGFSYGPRYLSDVLPFLLYLWMPVWGWVGRDWLRWGALSAALAVSVFIHHRGATRIEVHRWNEFPVSVNKDRGRIWDWKDAPFLRGLH